MDGPADAVKLSCGSKDSGWVFTMWEVLLRSGIFLGYALREMELSDTQSGNFLCI